MYMDEGRDDDAKAVLRSSNEIHNSKTAYENLGNIFFQEKDYNSALSYYLEAERLDPNYHYVLSDLGDCYQQLGQPRKTREYYVRAAEQLSKELKINPKQGNLWMTLAFYHAKSGNSNVVESDMNNAEKHGANDRRDPNYLQSLLLKARAFALLGNTERARALVCYGLDQGLTPVEVDLAPELATIQKSPDCTAHMKMQSPDVQKGRN
jgi:tetratricopeptide (TPR) repeat protein